MSFRHATIGVRLRGARPVLVTKNNIFEFFEAGESPARLFILELYNSRKKTHLALGPAHTAHRQGHVA